MPRGAFAVWTPKCDFGRFGRFGQIHLLPACSMALRIQGRQAGISRRHWLAFARDVGLPAPAAERVIHALLTSLAGCSGTGWRYMYVND